MMKGACSSLLAGALLMAVTTACTYFEVRSSGVPNLLANTMEWFEPDTAQGWTASVVPAGKHSQPPECKEGRPWTTKHAYVGMLNPTSMSGFGNNTGNAMNEHGLAVSGHAFRGAGTYTPSTKASTAVCEQQVGEWAVSQFKSVSELRRALPDVAVIAVPNPSTTNIGAQWAFADASGDSVVVDYKGGLLRIHNNTVGVLTNDPEYEWQLSNLDNYVGLSSRWPQSGVAPRATEVGPVPSAVGHGFNLLGLPGDLSPPSRFVRTFFLREYSLLASPPSSLHESMVIATGVLNAMHINQGFNSRAPGEAGYDYTQFCTLKAPAERLMYFRTYDDMQWRKVDLNTLDMTKSKSLKLRSEANARDVSAEFL